ncbi:MAG TPA: alkaline phosphatase family protein, partial [Candidatus Nitrosotenuis sp.]|nr:alkaline phosphatase family protein [Candidatus Nitrosotenuis sp.]
MLFPSYIDPGTGFVVVGFGTWLLGMLAGLFGGLALFFRRLVRFGKGNWPWLLLALVLLAGAALGRYFLLKEGQIVYPHRLVILGFDALSPQIVDEMMAAGQLPNLERLAAQGSYRRLATTNPAQSPVAWSGFATGQNPGKHGIYDFILRDPASYGLSLSLSRIEKGQARPVRAGRSFWAYAHQAGIPTVVLGCPVTFPPEKEVGRMLAGMGVPDLLGTEGTFTFYTSDSRRQARMTGGKSFAVRRAQTMVLKLIGPRTPGGQLEVPFKVTLKGQTAVAEWQGQRVELTPGRWSDWQSVSFSAGFLQTLRGIFRFYLVSTQPEFELYISPLNLDPRKPVFALSQPPGYAREIAEKLGLYSTMGMPMDSWGLNEGVLTEQAFLEQADSVLEERVRLLDYELARTPRGVLFCYFENADMVQHMFWRYRDPGHPLHVADPPDRERQAIARVYAQLDGVLGRVLQKLGPDDTVLVLSDHGFGDFRRAAHLNSWLREHGYLAVQGGGREGAELLRSVDWSRTRAYALGFGSVYLNLKGREGQGIVSPGAEAEALKAEIAAGLEAWT